MYKDPSGFERIGKSKKAEVILNFKIDEMSCRMRKPTICIGEDKTADQLCSISAFVFAARIVQSFFFLNPKFQASSLLL